MPEFIKHSEPDEEQLGLSPYMEALIQSYADRVGYILPDGTPTLRDRFKLALMMDRDEVDPYFTVEILAGRRLNLTDGELLMLAYAYKCGKLDRKGFFSRFAVGADLLALL